MKHHFTSVNLEKLIQEYSENQNFTVNILPRIRILLAIKKELNIISELNWQIEYNHADTNLNRITIHYKSQTNNDFNFFYEIPLSLKFELRVFLDKSSIHFIKLYNFLLSKEIIKKDEFPLNAAYHTIPHFVLNSETKRYDLSIVQKYSSEDHQDENLIDKKVKNDILSAIKIFNPIFDQLIAQFKI